LPPGEAAELGRLVGSYTQVTGAIDFESRLGEARTALGEQMIKDRLNRLERLEAIAAQPDGAMIDIGIDGMRLSPWGIPGKDPRRAPRYRRAGIRAADASRASW